MKVGKRGLKFNIGYDIYHNKVAMKWTGKTKSARTWCEPNEGWKYMCWCARIAKRQLLKAVE